METMAAEAKESGDLETAAADHDFTMSTATYGGDAATSVPEELQTAVDAIEEGEYTDVVETDMGYYIALLVSEQDEEATQERKEEIISERQSEFYTQTYESWAEDVEFTINEEVWKKVDFASPLTITTSTSSTDEENAASEETEEENTPSEEPPAEDEAEDDEAAVAEDEADGAAETSAEDEAADAAGEETGGEE